MSITISADYGYVVISSAFIGVVQFFLGGAVMQYRKVFSQKEFLGKPEVKALQEEHKKIMGSVIDKMGYPDMGNGKYAEHLSYEDWYTLNRAQRAHYNMVENSGSVLAALYGAGLFYPRIAAGLGFSYAIGRIIYTRGYMASGPSGRALGAVLSSIAMLGLWGASFIGGAYACGLVPKQIQSSK